MTPFHWQPFLRSIADAPADDFPRLLFAQWLEEKDGEPEYAEFIRVQCELEKSKNWHPRTFSGCTCNEPPHRPPCGWCENVTEEEFEECQKQQAEWDAKNPMPLQQLEYMLFSPVSLKLRKWTPKLLRLLTYGVPSSIPHNPGTILFRRGFPHTVWLTSGQWRGRLCQWLHADECMVCHGTGYVTNLAGPLFAAWPMIERVELVDGLLPVSGGRNSDFVSRIYADRIDFGREQATRWLASEQRRMTVVR